MSPFFRVKLAKSAHKWQKLIKRQNASKPCIRAASRVKPAFQFSDKSQVEFLESNWSKPDDGIWEVRGGRRHFTHSKMMAWVALDRAVRGIEEFQLKGDVERWKALRNTIHDEVCQKGYDAGRKCFTQSYGSDRLDASLLMMPLVGFLPITDGRVLRTVEAIERELMVDGFVYRYHPDESAAVDGLPPGEGVFIPCTYWLADCLNLAGRRADAVAIFERLLELRNDLGLLAEEYDPKEKQLLGNFPQAFSHVGLINTAANLSHRQGPAARRCG